MSSRIHEKTKMHTRLHPYTPLYGNGQSASYIEHKKMRTDSFDFLSHTLFSFKVQSVKSGAVLHLFTLSPGLNTVSDPQKVFSKSLWNEGRIATSSFI